MAGNSEKPSSPADTVSACVMAATVCPAASEAGKVPLVACGAASGAVEESPMVYLFAVKRAEACPESFQLGEANCGGDSKVSSAFVELRQETASGQPGKLVARRQSRGGEGGN